MLIKDLLIMRKDSNRDAIKCGQASITYKEIFSIVQSKATHIKKSLNVTDNIGIFLPNSIEYVISYFIITMLDKIIVPIGVNSMSLEVCSTIKYCELGLIITNTQYEETLKNILSKYEYKIILYNVDNNGFTEVGFGCRYFLHNSDFSKSLDEDCTALLIHTSGTTSNPKRVMLTHKNLMSNVKSIVSSLKLTEKETTLIVLPLYLASANTSQLLVHLYLGASIVIMKDIFLPSKLLQLIDKEKITNFTGAPFMLSVLSQYTNKFNYDLSSLRIVCFGGGPLQLHSIKLFILNYPQINFVQMYGQTEAATRITHLLPGDALRKMGSIGMPIPGIEVKIVDEKGNIVKQGDIGEIIAKGQNIMKGYYKRFDETRKVLKNGWLYTGDLGKFDNENYIYIIGRRKNIIISGGHNIYPEEIEEILMSYYIIKEAFVYGEKSNLYGEIPIAIVTLNDNNVEFIEKDIFNYCTLNLASYKIPKAIFVENSIPKTLTGKIIRSREHFCNEKI